MLGYRVARHGGPEALEWGELLDPVPAPGEVLVRVRACALNHLDLWVRNGVPGHRFPLPLVPGCEIAGVVEAHGPGVDDPAPGTPVLVGSGVSCGVCPYCESGRDALCARFGILGEDRDGGYAELVAVPRRNLFDLPRGLSYVEAAAIPLVAEFLLPRTRGARLTRASLVILTAGVWLVTGLDELEQGALFFNPRLLSGLAVVAALLVGAWIDGRRRATGNERAYQAGIALPLGWYVGLGEVLHVVETLDPAWRAVAVSLYTTAWAAVLLLAGFRWRLPVLRYLALGTFGAVILKVGFYDLRTTPLPLRVLVTGVLGVVLLVAAYGYARRKEEARAG